MLVSFRENDLTVDKVQCWFLLKVEISFLLKGILHRWVGFSLLFSKAKLYPVLKRIWYEGEHSSIWEMFRVRVDKCLRLYTKFGPMPWNRCHMQVWVSSFGDAHSLRGLTVGLSKVYMGTGSILRVYF